MIACAIISFSVGFIAGFHIRHWIFVNTEKKYEAEWRRMCDDLKIFLAEEFDKK